MNQKNKEESIPSEGVVTEAVRGAFIVKVDNSEHTVFCTLGGKLRKNYIRVVPGDRVRIEISPYDFGKGRIIYRGR